MIDLPRVTSALICCPTCRQRVGFRNDGLPVPHWLDDRGAGSTSDGALCPAVLGGGFR